jgi:hypothetical protein
MSRILRVGSRLTGGAAWGSGRSVTRSDIGWVGLTFRPGGRNDRCCCPGTPPSIRRIAGMSFVRLAGPDNFRATIDAPRAMQPMAPARSAPFFKRGWGGSLHEQPRSDRWCGTSVGPAPSPVMMENDVGGLGGEEPDSASPPARWVGRSRGGASRGPRDLVGRVTSGKGHECGSCVRSEDHVGRRLSRGPAPERRDRRQLLRPGQPEPSGWY